MAGNGAVIAVCGHEAAYGRALEGLLGPDVSIVPNGRALFRTVAAHLRRGEPVVVVPMTLGRDPGLVADTARTLRAVPAGGPAPAAVLLAEPFGTAQHLVAWLRAAAGRAPDDAALLVTAPCGDPFEDAELHRVAALVRRYGRHALVEVAFEDGDPDPAEGVRRCGLLGAERVALLPASFTAAGPVGAGPVPVTDAGPLVPAPALRRVLDERVADARRRLRDHGDDGVTAGLAAADHHGHAHTHPAGEGHGHAHVHPHEHGPGGVHRHHHHPSAAEADRGIRSIA
ncbi:cobalamin biosynthesis protein CbiX [Streptomyces sp. 130]|uniref:sirohydrochlorin chelatase n=1 Tax=Streptomyces sp. 130 TaxID=2591006 RepID=UPI00117FC7ED|nr:cobalamin biosynthesis protein CbiX [Streptomyces sp. 130]TRV75713.1 cobalamin biosynthesis protein CbiX [Streptomyces sp. 130]